MAKDDKALGYGPLILAVPAPPRSCEYAASWDSWGLRVGGSPGILIPLAAAEYILYDSISSRYPGGSPEAEDRVSLAKYAL